MEHKIILTYDNIEDYIDHTIQICNITPCQGGYNVDILHSEDEHGKMIKAFLPMPWSFIPRSYFSEFPKNPFIEAKFYSINVPQRKIRVSRMAIVDAVFTFEPSLYWSKKEYEERIKSLFSDGEDSVNDNSDEMVTMLDLWEKLEREFPDYYVLMRSLKLPMSKDEYELYIKPIFITYEDRSPDEIQEPADIKESDEHEVSNHTKRDHCSYGGLSEEQIMWGLGYGYDDYI